VQELLRAAGRAIHGFPFRLPRNLVLYVRMIVVLEGVCKRLDPEFKFLPILSSTLREEGVEAEMYREEIMRRVRKLARSLEDALELPTLIKEYLKEDDGDPGRGLGCLLPGILAGAGASGIAAWALLPGIPYAFLATGAGALASGLAYCIARRRAR